MIDADKLLEFACRIREEATKEFGPGTVQIIVIDKDKKLTVEEAEQTKWIIDKYTQIPA